MPINNIVSDCVTSTYEFVNRNKYEITASSYMLARRMTTNAVELSVDGGAMAISGFSALILVYSLNKKLLSFFER
jgi:hypothetical protein